MEIKTYDEMNRLIAGQLRLGGSKTELYAAQRIEELEQQLAALQAEAQRFHHEIDMLVVHPSRCMITQSVDAECDCGMSDLIALADFPLMKALKDAAEKG